MRENPYNYSQWHWIADRFGEGYTVTDLAAFLGVSRKCVHDNMVRVGRKVPLEDRIPLSERVREFNDLIEDDSPKIAREIPVIGVDRNGKTFRFKSITEASRSIGVDISQVSNAIKYRYRCRGYHWRKEEA